MTLRHLLHPKYLIRRLALKCYEWFHPDHPWIAAGAIRFCATHLNQRMRALEWGSGRSTLWWAKHVGSLTSVEHNPEWHGRIAQCIKKENLDNIDYRLVALDHDETDACVARYEPSPRYVAVVDEFVDASLDFVVIDGHYRPACLLAALPKLRRGGYLLVDNVNWMRIDDWGVPADWRIVVNASNAITQTIIWAKP